MSSVASLRIYRTLLRQAGVVRRAKKPLALSKPIDINSWGRCRFGGSNDHDEDDSLQPPPAVPGSLGDLLNLDEAEIAQGLLPRDDWPRAPALSGDDCAELIRRLFRRGADVAAASASASAASASATDNAAKARLDMDDMAFSAMRIANALMAQWYRSSVSESSGVRVVLDYKYVQPDESGHDVYAYRLIVENRRDHAVQLLGRHWHFEDSDGAVVEVPRWGEGVVGLQPHLRPGQWVEYVSGTTLRVSPGVMQGALLMVDQGGENWEAEVIISSPFLSKDISRYIQDLCIFIFRIQ